MRFILEISIIPFIFAVCFSLPTNSSGMLTNQTNSVTNSTVIKQQPVNVSQALHKPNLNETEQIVAIEGGGQIKLKSDNRSTTIKPTTSTSKQSSTVLVKGMEGGLINISAIKKVNDTSDIHEKSKISARKGVEEETTKKISARKGVENVKLNLTSTTHKPKPLFTMMTGDKLSKESESFIESPTTGRDYVLPIVLVILGCPALVYIIKFLYKRGTEFTERQQYHRMYLIDGMYNAR